MPLIYIDFETYSAAGYKVTGAGEHVPITSSPPHGLPAVGVAVYAEHPTADIICLAYAIGDGSVKLWKPSDPDLPADLLDAIANGDVISAWNIQFEYWIWQNVAVKKYGFPPLNIESLSCTMAAARAFGLPGALGKAADALGLESKLSEGARLIRKFSIPHKKTGRTDVAEHPEDADLFCAYCMQDVEVERSIARRIPALSASESATWRLDFIINLRGVHIDHAMLKKCLYAVRNETARLSLEFTRITAGTVDSAAAVAQFKKWIATRINRPIESVNKGAVDTMLADPLLPPDVRRALEIRVTLGASSVKKLYSIERMLASDGRLHGLFQYHGAATGRFAGRGPQPQNLPSGGPTVRFCRDCDVQFNNVSQCPQCGSSSDERAWDHDCAVLFAADPNARNYINLIDPVSGCLRALFSATPGCQLVCSDYSSIEAVVIAFLAGETWRQDAFMRGDDIYMLSAAKIGPGITRKQGKVAELASSYNGGIGAWRAFGAEGTDLEIKEMVESWRAASPNITKFWRDTEKAARSAIQHPNQVYSFGVGSNLEFIFNSANDVLYLTLPSGRRISYHKPLLLPATTSWGARQDEITHMAYASVGGWQRTKTYGGKLVENICQGVARDILTHAMNNIASRGDFDIVLHIHDEVVVETSRTDELVVADLEKTMSLMPDWARNWPVRATGGWAGKHFRK